VFLPARLRLPNRRGMPHATLNRELLHQPQKPTHRAGRFDPDHDRCWQCGVKLPDLVALVFQRSLDNLPGVVIQHRNALLRRVEIATYHPHLGLLRPERCEGGHHTVYAGRREADVVMTSMFMRVSSNCAHHVRPPAGPDTGYRGARPLSPPLLSARFRGTRPSGSGAGHSWAHALTRLS
jgi:hypothetical protein